ncbi:biopolymer transport protein ExbD [Natronocella acetinitrilica]|uniref:Biopolymer transport protein ExbD n=1 Tax=Natronocella acetinitrilica TaxID=414046 RepID=A0AAE3KBZ3_9GAMM|nr:biopolymer transport protein ExbD [Natronocella acetinitrilica]
MNLRHRRREDPEITLTPLIDVVFLMLIFFMVSTTFMRQADLELTLPEASREPGEQIVEPIELAINAEGEFFINGRALVNNQVDTVRRGLLQAREDTPDAPLVIRADARTPHQNLVIAMDAASQANISRLSIATVPQEQQ